MSDVPVMFDDVRDLYQEIILDHGRHPRNFRRIADADGQAEGDNPMCGDRVAVWVKRGADGRLADVSFEGRGCAICIASGSLMTELCVGHNDAEARVLVGAVRDFAMGGRPLTPALSPNSSSMGERGKQEGSDPSPHPLPPGEGRGEGPPAWLADALERLAPLSGVADYPSRVKCATLAWHALDAALKDGGRVSTE
jgi:nitrogen fixation NifU-like protein